jgi:hypothetical protein
MLQVSLALHHHHTYSYHDEQDCFHSAPTSLDKHVDSLDAVIGLAGQCSHYSPLISATVNLFQEPADGITIETPDGSRAPPAGTPGYFCCRSRSLLAC